MTNPLETLTRLNGVNFQVATCERCSSHNCSSAQLLTHEVRYAAHALIRISLLRDGNAIS